MDYKTTKKEKLIEMIMEWNKEHFWNTKKELEEMSKEEIITKIEKILMHYNMRITD